MKQFIIYYLLVSANKLVSTVVIRGGLWELLYRS